MPVANPNTEDNLLRLAWILAKTYQGTLLPLHILSDRGEAMEPADKMQQTQLLAAAETVAHAAACAVELTSCTILKNRQDACSTKSEFSCGTGRKACS